MSERKPASTNSINRVELKEHCGMVYAMYLISGRWKLIILHRLSAKKLRYTELKKWMPNITDRMLTLQLQHLEKDDLILRKVFSQVPVKVEYELTQSARELMLVCQGLEEWGIVHRKKQAD
jgi:DNA-binding HxlR family transcriptional regulator